MLRFRMIPVMLCVLCALCGYSPYGFAAEPKILTLDDALAIATDKNRDIQKAKEYRNFVLGKYVEERSAALPDIAVAGGVMRDHDGSAKAFGVPARQDILSGGVSFSQPLFTWGKVGAAIRAAKVGLKTADEQLRLYSQAALKDVSDAFYTVLLARDLRDLAVQNLEQKKRHLDEAQRKYAAGIATDYDVLAADVGVQNANPDVVRGENGLRISRDRLRFVLGIDAEVDVSGSLDGGAVCSTDYDEAMAVAEKKRPELNDIRLRQTITEELITIANAGDKPRLDAKGGYGWRDISTARGDGDGPAWNIGLSLSWPVFDGLKTRGKVAQERSNLTSLRIDEAKQRDAVALEVREAISRVNESQEIVAGLAGTVRQAERLLKMAEQGYELGVKTRLDVDDAEFSLIQARSSLSRAKKDLKTACVNVEWVKGVLELGAGQIKAGAGH